MTLKKSNKEYNKEWRLKNVERLKERKKEWYLKNKEQIKEYLLKNIEQIKEQRKKYYLKNIEQIKEYQLKNKEYIKEKKREYYLKNIEQRKEYLLKNREHILAQKKEHYLKNIEQIKEYHRRPKTQERRRNRVNNRYNTDINFRLLTICRARVYKALKGFDKSASTMELIGCTPDELRSHIESKFEPWMNWENQGKGGWDIEHIKACFHFNLEDSEQQRACFNWSNLQPMEHIENIKKGTG